MNKKDLLIIEDNLPTSDFLANAAKESNIFALVHREHTFKNAKHSINAIPAPGMVLCDIGLPDGDGLELVAMAVDLEIPVIVISSMGDEKTVIRAIELGASGYLHKDLENHDITSAIQQVIEGGAPLSPSIASHLLRRLRGSASPASDTASDRPAKCCSESRHSHSMTRCNQGLGSSERLQANEELQYKDEPNGRENKEMLTIREIQILQLIAHGHLLSEVAKELNISVHTVSSHNRNIYRKLQAHSRSEAVYKALKTGIIASNI